MSDPARPGGPRGPVPATPPSPAARERVIDALAHHFAADRLTLDEFERRVELAYAAGAEQQLDALVADVGGVQLAAANAPLERISAVLGNQERSGPGVMPRHLRIRCVLGNVELDLRQTTFEPGVSEIDVATVLGNVEITVPAGVRVEIVGSAFLGSFAASGARDVGDGATVLRVRGRAVFGNVEARSTRGGAPPAFPRQDHR